MKGGTEVINCLSECSKNLIKGIVPMNKDEYTVLHAKKEALRQLASKETPLAKKRKILLKPGLIDNMVPPVSRFFSSSSSEDDEESSPADDDEEEEEDSSAVDEEDDNDEDDDEESSEYTFPEFEYGRNSDDSPGRGTYACSEPSSSPVDNYDEEYDCDNEEEEEDSNSPSKCTFPELEYDTNRDGHKTTPEGAYACPEPGCKARYAWLTNLRRHVKVKHQRHIDGRPASPSTVEKTKASMRYHPYSAMKLPECLWKING